MLRRREEEKAALQRNHREVSLANAKTAKVLSVLHSTPCTLHPTTLGCMRRCKPYSLNAQPWTQVEVRPGSALNVKTRSQVLEKVRDPRKETVLY